MFIAYFAAAGMIALGTLISITQVGKSREPLTTSAVAWIVVVNLGIFFLLIWAGARL